MQEFLALNTDARIAFVKKPFIVSRIDKVLFKVTHHIACFDWTLLRFVFNASLGRLWWML